MLTHHAFVPHADLKILDPIWTTAYITRNHGYMIFDTLFALDADLKLRPQMVDKWTVSRDAMKYSFTLRDGLKFHDGQPVTAEDCVASIRRWGARDAVGRLMMAAVGKMAPVDPRPLFVLLWSATQFYGDFERIAALALNKKKLAKGDFQAAAAFITEIVLNGCTPARA